MAKKKAQKKEVEYIDPRQLIALEEELERTKQEYGIVEKEKWWVRIGDWLVNNTGKREKVRVNRHLYCWLALLLGNFGVHRFYTKQYLLGFIYLAFSWTFIPFGMAIIDIMIALPMKPDENGTILL